LNKLQWLVWLAIGSFAGLLIVAAIYYLLTQTTGTGNRIWHDMIPNDALRHNIRDVSEGLLGGLLGQQIVWNHYRKRKALSRLDEFEIRHHIANPKDDRRFSIWQLLSTPWLVLLYAVPGFIVAQLIILMVHILHDPHHAVNGAHALRHLSLWGKFWTKTQNVWTENWQQKLTGYAAAYVMGRRPAKGVFDDLQLWFAERRVLIETGGFGPQNRSWVTEKIDQTYHFISRYSPVRKIPLWIYPPTYQARYNEVRANYAANQECIPKSQHGPYYAILLTTGLVAGFVLAIFGEYVFVFIA
jgi:hypothetical protein